MGVLKSAPIRLFSIIRASKSYVSLIFMLCDIKYENNSVKIL